MNYEDVYIENPPIKQIYTIEIEFEYDGKSNPIPVIDPWNDYETNLL